MKLLIAGMDESAQEFSDKFGATNVQVERCATARSARHLMEHAESPYSMVLLNCAVAPDELAAIHALASRSPATTVAEVNALPAAAVITDSIETPMDSPIDTTAEDWDECPLDSAEIERWRNVLTFAKRSPDEFPALRDALGQRRNLFEYHAPVKRSA